MPEKIAKRLCAQRMANFRLLLILSIISLCLEPIAQAADPLSISVFLEFEQEYNDNVYTTASDQVRDLISNIGAGTTIELKTEKSHLDLNYRIKKVFYYDIEDDDGIDTTEMNYTYHNLSLDASTFLASRLRVGISEKYLRSRRIGEYYLLTNRISLAEYWNNRISPYIEYQLDERIIFRLKYQYDILNYLESFTVDDQDSTEHRGYLTLEYRLNPRNTVALDYQYWKRDYDTFFPYQTHQAVVGFKREFNEILSGEIWGGYQTVDYKKEQEGTVEDFQGPVYNVSLTAKTEKSNARLMFEQTSSDLGDIGGSYYQVRRFSADMGHLFLEKIFMQLYGFYQQLRYGELLVMTNSGDSEKRKDNVWSIGAKVEYPIHKWITIALSLSHAERESNEIGMWGDYTQNIIFFTIKTRYETKR